VTHEIDPASIDPNTVEGRDILVHVCVYCHQIKESVAEANACEESHQNDPSMTSQDLHSRFVQYEKKFLKRGYRGSKQDKRKR